MADLDPASLTSPISDDAPCGPDLDMEFDMDFMNVVAEVEGLLPTRYFSFESDSINYKDFYERIGELLERTRDLRLLVPLAKLKILDGDLEGFVAHLNAIGALLTDQWDALHPQPADFLELSMGQLSTLDDMPNSVLPLQHTTLVRTRRAGAISLRKWQVSTGDVNAREDEEVVDAGSILQGLSDADEGDVTSAVDKLTRGQEAVSKIVATCTEKAGATDAPALERLGEAFEQALSMFRKASGDEPATDAADGDAAADTGMSMGGGAASSMTVQIPSGDITSREDASEALYQAAKYFALKEPSSPVSLILREARNAADKSFYELITDLMPASADSATVSFGRHPKFSVQLYALNSRNPAPDYETDADDTSSSDGWEVAGLDDEINEDTVDGDGGDTSEGGDGASQDGWDASSESEDTPAEDDGWGSSEATPPLTSDTPSFEGSEDTAEEDDGWGSSEPVAPITSDTPTYTGSDEDNAAEAEDSTDDGWGSSSETTESADEGWSASSEPEPEPEQEEDAQDKDRFVANNRPEAIALLEKAQTFYRIAEPSSPIPMILDRAIELSSKTFMDLLQDVMPPSALGLGED